MKVICTARVFRSDTSSSKPTCTLNRVIFTFLFLTVLVLNTKTAHADTVLSYAEPHEKLKWYIIWSWPGGCFYMRFRWTRTALIVSLTLYGRFVNADLFATGGLVSLRSLNVTGFLLSVNNETCSQSRVREIPWQPALMILLLFFAEQMLVT